MGGAWERMIRSVKQILGALMKLQTLNDEGFLTLITEVERILNSWPIVPIFFDSQGDEPLTPNHLLLMRGNANSSPRLFSDNECYSRKRWAQIQYLSNRFWKRWLKEFFPNLLRGKNGFSPSRNLVVDDIVLIADDMQQRFHWVLGRVLKTFSDKRGLVRRVQVKSRNRVVMRPISKLCLIIEKRTLDK